MALLQSASGLHRAHRLSGVEWSLSAMTAIGHLCYKPFVNPADIPPDLNLLKQTHEAADSHTKRNGPQQQVCASIVK